MIAWLFFILFVWGVSQFVFDSVIVPTMQRYLKFRVYKIRDRFRMMKMSHPELVSDELFALCESASSMSIRVIPFATPLLIARVRSMPDSEEVERNRAMIENCELREMQANFQSLYHRILQAVVFNSSIWTVILVPSFWMVSLCRGLLNFSWIKELVRDASVAILTIALTRGKSAFGDLALNAPGRMVSTRV